jgi:tetratricopeptide (TPR) repeat protein
LGQVLAERRYADVAEQYERAVELWDDEAPTEDAYAWRCYGVALSGEGRQDEAETVLARATAITPDDPDVWRSRGVAAYRAGRYEDAAEFYARAVELAPDKPELSRFLGDALNELGRTEQALAAFDRALAIDTAQSRAWRGRGEALTEPDRLEEAVVAYKRSLELDPNDEWVPVRARLVLDRPRPRGGRPRTAGPRHRARSLLGGPLARAAILTRAGALQGNVSIHGRAPRP